MQSLCIHEMIVRAFKHILQAVIAVVDKEKLATSIAGALNLMLGVPENKESDKSCKIHPLVWKWLDVFLKKRFDWDLSSFNYNDLRKYAILRGLCHKVLEVGHRICRSGRSCIVDCMTMESHICIFFIFPFTRSALG